MGSWSPSLPWPKRKAGQRRIGALFAFGAAIPLASACFEIYCEYGKHVAWLAGYVLILAMSFLFYWFRVRPKGWQTRYQDFRALAEALRVQFYWAACGVPLAVSDNYLRHQEDDIGWIRLALRGPSLLGLGAALGACRTDDTEDNVSIRTRIASHWIAAQHHYFTLKVTHYKRAAERTDLLAKYSLIGAYGLAVCILVV